MHISFLFLKKARFKSLRGIDAMQETSNKSLDAILEVLRQLTFRGRAWRKTALRANVHSMIFFTKSRKGREVKNEDKMMEMQ